jgi:flagellar biosynthesis/type III secretory pathway M-ring protein FliF/YscJ
LGLRPALKILVADSRPEPTPLAFPATAASAALMAPPSQVNSTGEVASDSETGASARSKSPTEHLNTLVDVDVDRAAQVLKKWLNDAERNAA